MITRSFRLDISVPCETDEVEDAVTESIIAQAKTINAMAVLLSHNAMPRVKLTYHSSRTGKVTLDIAKEDEPPREQSNDTLDDLTRGETHGSGFITDTLADLTRT